MKICILNASNPKSIHLESDEYVDLRDRTSCFKNGKAIKQCRSWHSWAYALETEFFVYQKPKWPGIFQYDGVIILVSRDIGEVLPLVKKLKAAGKKVGISLHEGMQDFLSGSGVPGENVVQRWIDLKSIVSEADFYINIFGQMGAFFEGWLGQDNVKYCGHSAPFDWNHGLTIPWEERPYDILVGTRTFNQRLSRNTFATLGALNGFARDEGKSVHFLCEDPVPDNFLSSLGLTNITLHRGPLEWNDWLKFLSQFKTICHHDTSSNLGQICLDAALVGVIPVGSTTWNNICFRTDDHGDLGRMTTELWRWTRAIDGEGLALYHLDEFRETFAPDRIREQLLAMFEVSDEI